MVNGQIVASLQIQHRLPDFRVRGLLIDRSRLLVGIEDFDKYGVLEFAGGNALRPLFIRGIVFGFRRRF
jgi:hypothetical protein